MRHTVWYHEQQIGETDFELVARGRKRAGVFRPTAFGLTVLPAITAIVPALFDFRDMCERSGIDTEDERPETADAAMDAFGRTSEGERVMSAVRQVAALEVRDEHGHTMRWESILISDMQQIRALVDRFPRGDAFPAPRAVGELPLLRYLISLTLARQRYVAPRPAMLA